MATDRVQRAQELDEFLQGINGYTGGVRGDDAPPIFRESGGPLTASVVQGLLMGGLGYGAGRVAGEVYPEVLDRQAFARRSAVYSAMLPLLAHAPQLVKNYRRGGLKALNDPQEKQAADEAPAIDWEKYKGSAQDYLDRSAFKGTPLTGEMMGTAASNTYARTGVEVPVELPLLQAQFESGMGRTGKSPANNPWNVGEWDSGTRQTFPDTAAGTQAYYDLISKDYLGKGRTMEDLLGNFVNHAGNRYASNPEYEANLRGQLPTVRKYTGTPQAVKPEAPAKSTETAAAHKGTTYTIQVGDTLSALAKKFGTTIEALQKLNGLKSPHAIAAGATLKVPQAVKASSAYWLGRTLRNR